MKTKVEKLGPGSWAVLVNGQRHHEIFLTRAAARREAKKQKEQQSVPLSQVRASVGIRT